MTSKNPIVLTIPKSDQYLIGTDRFFQITVKDKTRSVTYRDISCEIGQNVKPVLLTLAKAVNFKNAAKMKKDELVETLRPYIQFE